MAINPEPITVPDGILTAEMDGIYQWRAIGDGWLTSTRGSSSTSDLIVSTDLSTIKYIQSFTTAFMICGVITKIKSNTEYNVVLSSRISSVTEATHLTLVLKGADMSLEFQLDKQVSGKYFPEAQAESPYFRGGQTRYYRVTYGKLTNPAAGTNNVDVVTSMSKGLLPCRNNHIFVGTTNPPDFSAANYHDYRTGDLWVVYDNS